MNIQQTGAIGLSQLPIAEAQWHHNYDSLLAYNSGGDNYIFQQHDSLGSDNIWFIQQVLPNGQFGAQTAAGTFGNFYEYITSYTAGGKTYLVGFDPGGDNYIFIQELMPDGTMGAQTDSRNWGNSYKSLVAFNVGGRNFIFQQHDDSGGDNFWFIQEVLPGGTFGAQTAAGTFGNFYEYITTYTAGGKVFLVGYDPGGDNYIFIQELMPGGIMGDQTDSRNWENSYDNLAAFNFKGRNYIYQQRGSTFTTKDTWYIQEVQANGTFGSQVGSGTRSNMYKYAASYRAGNNTYLMIGDNAGGTFYLFIYRVVSG